MKILIFVYSIVSHLERHLDVGIWMKLVFSHEVFAVAFVKWSNDV